MQEWPEVISHLDRFTIKYKDKTETPMACCHCHEWLFEGDQARFTVITIPGTESFESFTCHADPCGEKV